MTKIALNTLMAVAVAVATLVGTAGAYAADPTQGRINARKASVDRTQYFKCAEFSLRVLRACTAQNPNNQGPCRTHYQGNISRCQAKFL